MTEASRLRTDLSLAYQAFANLVANLDQADLAVPTVNDGWTVRDVINHVVDGDAWAVTFLQTGEDVFTSTDYVGTDPPITAVQRTHESLLGVLNSKASQPRDTPIRRGGHSISDVIAIRIDEFVGHGWDVAQATGKIHAISPEVVERCIIHQGFHLDPIDQRGAFFKAPQSISPEAPLADQLAAFLGKPVPQRQQ